MKNNWWFCYRRCYKSKKQSSNGLKSHFGAFEACYNFKSRNHCKPASILLIFKIFALYTSTLFCCKTSFYQKEETPTYCWRKLRFSFIYLKYFRWKLVSRQLPSPENMSAYTLLLTWIVLALILLPKVTKGCGNRKNTWMTVEGEGLNRRKFRSSSKSFLSTAARHKNIWLKIVMQYITFLSLTRSGFT